MGISIGGLSGFDTDTIVSQLMQLERVPITKLEARKEKYAAQKSTFESFNLKLLSLKSSTENLLNSSTWSAKNVNVSNTSLLSATANSTAAEGAYKFTNILLGTQAYSTSTGDIAANSIKNSNKTLSALSDDADFDTALTGSGSGKFNIVLRNKTDGSEVKSSQIEFDTTTDTLNTLITKINRASVGVTAFYDEDSATNGKFVLTANDAGNYFIDITTDVDGGGDDDLGIIDTLKLTSNIGAVPTPGDSANFISGIPTTAKLNGVDINPIGNSYTVNGTTVIFLGDGSSTVIVSKNSSSIVSQIKDFVDKYNEVQDFIKEQTKLTTVSTTSNKTTDVSSRGPLAGNFLVTDISYNLNAKTLQGFTHLRNADQYSMLSEIGISLGAYGTDKANKLVVDEAKLTSALENNPDQVKLLFGYNTTDPTNTNSVVNNGIAHQVKEYLNPITRFKGLISNEQTSIQTIIDSLNSNIERMNERLYTVEETYRKQFARMEQQLAQLNSQGDYFSSQLANLNRK